MIMHSSWLRTVLGNETALDGSSHVAAPYLVAKRCVHATFRIDKAECQPSCPVLSVTAILERACQCMYLCDLRPGVKVVLYLIQRCAVSAPSGGCGEHVRVCRRAKLRQILG